jgi:hypothetical protein
LPLPPIVGAIGIIGFIHPPDNELRELVIVEPNTVVELLETFAPGEPSVIVPPEGARETIELGRNPRVASSPVENVPKTLPPPTTSNPLPIDTFPFTERLLPSIGAVALHPTVTPKLLRPVTESCVEPRDTRVDTETEPVTLVPIVRLETARVLVSMPGIILTGKVPPEIVDTFSCLLCMVLVAVRLPLRFTLTVETGNPEFIFIVDAVIVTVDAPLISTALDDTTRTLLGENIVRVDCVGLPPKLIKL